MSQNFRLDHHKKLTFHDLEKLTEEYSSIIPTALAELHVKAEGVNDVYFKQETSYNKLVALAARVEAAKGSQDELQRFLEETENAQVALKEQVDTLENEVDQEYFSSPDVYSETNHWLADDIQNLLNDLYSFLEDIDIPIGEPDVLVKTMECHLNKLEVVEQTLEELEKKLIPRSVQGKMSHSLTVENLKIVSLDVKDMRFPTSLHADGSDAMHTDPDYSCAYVTIKIQSGVEGYGLTFTLGRGTEIVVEAIKTLSDLVVGQVVSDIYKDFGQFWRSLTSESQLRWIGPEKGVTHLATAAIINALWDLWGRLLKKPVWQLLADMDPEQLVNCIDFRYLSNVITKEEAVELLRKGRQGKEERMNKLLEKGYPCYTTQAGWLGYSNEKIQGLAQKFMDAGFTAFKVKVGRNLYDDIKRLEFIRSIIGWEKTLMVDANQVWEVQEAIDWMAQLAQFKPLWIEEPTSPDDVLGHAQIARALKPLGISVASGEMCCNRVLFKQFLQADAIQYCQIDSARIGGVNEILGVYLMAAKLGVKVCPHAGGVGLCEMVQHLQMWDYVSLSGSSEGKWVEYVDQQHEHFVHPTIIENAHYLAPRAPGYNTELKKEALEGYVYPYGKEWEAMFAKGIFRDPRKHKK